MMVILFHLFCPVTFPSLEGIAQCMMRKFTKAGPAMDSLGGAAVKIIKARKQEEGDSMVSVSTAGHV